MSPALLHDLLFLFFFCAVFCGKAGPETALALHSRAPPCTAYRRPYLLADPLPCRYDKTIMETEAAYMKILESSQTLLHVLKRESVNLTKKRQTSQ